jgi:hypothetical protein
MGVRTRGLDMAKQQRADPDKEPATVINTEMRPSMPARERWPCLKRAGALPRAVFAFSAATEETAAVAATLVAAIKERIPGRESRSRSKFRILKNHRAETRRGIRGLRRESSGILRRDRALGR